MKKELFLLQDKKYLDFQSKLIPNIEKKNFIGVRTPELRKLAKKLVKNNSYQPFLDSLPHQYFDENQLHAFILCELNDYKKCLNEVNKFLPYIDNWATCDQMIPKAFKDNQQLLILDINNWLKSKNPYTIRFAIGMLMRYFLDDNFDEKYLHKVLNIKSNEYYVNMMRAWYFATALAKQYSTTIPILENTLLEPWTHNKTIQKAIESYRIDNDKKIYLKSLKIK